MIRSFRTLLHSAAFLALVGAATSEAAAQCGTPISTFPYYEGFESAPAWTAGGSNSDWAWGTPAHPTINGAGGGTKAWCVGGLTGSFYNYSELSYLESPCFDLTTLDHPWISFKLNWLLERQYDGLVLQYSLDGGSTYTNVGAYGDADDCLNANWYNSSNIVNLTSASPRHGWSGGPSGSCSAGGSGGWITAKHCLAYLANAPSVRFRFLFGAGSQCNSYDGAAIDDILIQNAPPNAPAINYACNGNTVTFTNAGGGCPTVFAWDFGDPASGAANYAATENATHTFSTAGNYTITYTQSSGCAASGTVTQDITFLDATVQHTDANCGPGSGSASVVVNNAASPNYAWTPGGETTASITGLSGGTYGITVTAPNACPFTAQVVIAQSGTGLTVQGTTHDASCAGAGDGSAILTVSGGAPAYQYDWSPSGGTQATATDLTAGTYTCDITDANGCTTAYTVLIGEPTPVVVTTPAQLATCAGTPITIQADASGGTGPYTYAWSPDGPTVTPPATTTYTVIATDANGCTSAPAQTEVAVGASITPSFTVDVTEGCAPLCVDLTATDQVIDLAYAWDFGDGNTATGWTATHCYTEGGVYDVSLTVTDDTGCSGTALEPGLINAWPQPDVVFSASATTVTTDNARVQFANGTANADLFVWHFGDAAGSYSTDVSPAFTFTDFGCHTVTLVAANSFGCAAQDSTVICVEDPYAVYVPNTFTPNGDGFNDVFGVVGSVRVPQDYQLTVFDRWGRELWSSTTPYATWDGSGTPEGVYVWKLVMRGTEGQRHEHIGHVALIR